MEGPPPLQQLPPVVVSAAPLPVRVRSKQLTPAGVTSSAAETHQKRRQPTIVGDTREPRQKLPERKVDMSHSTFCTVFGEDSFHFYSKTRSGRRLSRMPDNPCSRTKHQQKHLNQK